MTARYPLVLNGTTIEELQSGDTLQGSYLSSSDIGTSVQAYDADTAKYDDTTANFVGTLQNGGSNVLVDSDIGSTVQAYNANILTSSDIGSTVQGYDADTAKLDVAQTFTAAQTMTALKETKVAVSASEIDLATGNYFTKTISTNTTFTVANVASSGSVSAFVLDLTDGGAATVTWWSGITWNAATAPTLTASGVDTLAFFTYDGGTTWRGFVLGQGMA